MIILTDAEKAFDKIQHQFQIKLSRMWTQSEHPCLVPDLRGNAYNFSPLRMILLWVCHVWPLLS